jgi:hypothetical protein
VHVHNPLAFLGALVSLLVPALAVAEIVLAYRARSRLWWVTVAVVALVALFFAFLPPVAARDGWLAVLPAGGLHVHVGVPDRELAVQVCNHLQAWLPVIRALTGNSPLFQGTDTGHASWRCLQLLHCPGVGPTPWFADADRTVADLITAGVMLDEAMVYWYARLSRRIRPSKSASTTSARTSTTPS